MKIAIATSEFPPISHGGISTYYRNLAELLSTAGHDVTVLTDAPEPPPAEVEATLTHARIVRLGAEVRALFEKQRRDGIASYAALTQARGLTYRRHIEAEDQPFEVVEAPEYGGEGAFLTGLGVTASLITSHASTGQVAHHSGLQPTAKVAWRSQREIESLLGADEISCYSPANQEDWLRFLGRSPLLLRAPFRITRSDTEIPEPPAGTSTSQSKLRGIVVGRLNNWKGIFETIEALSKARAAGLDIELCWVGRDQDAPGEGISSVAQHLRQEHADLWGNGFEWRESASPSEVRQLQAGADFALIPSRWDTFNFTVLEAMCAGTPVVVSRGAGASYLCRDDENALVVDPGNADELCRAMERMQDAGLRRRLAEAAFQTLSVEFSAKTIIEERICGYESAIARHEYRRSHPYGELLRSPQTSLAPAKTSLASRLSRRLGVSQ